MATLSTQYSPLKTSELKATTAKKIKGFWEQELKNLGIEFESTEPGILANVEHIGTDYFIENFQPYAWDSEVGEVFDGYEVYTLGELAASREAEQELIQFEINTAKVESFLTDAQIGLLKVRQLLSPIEVLYIKDGGAIIGGGRHRTTGLLTLFKFIDGYQDIKVAVASRHVNNKDEAINYIFASNASRNMTPFEKQKLIGARKGLSIVRDGGELLEKINSKAGLTDISGIAGFYFAAEGAEAEELVNQTPDTLGKIGKSFITAFTKLLKGIDGSAPKTVYLHKGTDGSYIASTIIKFAFNNLVQSWEAYLQEIREPIKDRKTGNQKVDETTGEPIYSINVSRNASTIATTLAEGIFSQLEDELKQVFSAAQEAEKQAQQAKLSEKQAKQAKAQAKAQDAVLDYIQSAGIDLPPEVLAQLQQKKIAAETKAAQAAAAPAPASDNLAADLDALLS